MLAFVDVLAEEPRDLAELSPEEVEAAGARVCDDVLLRHKIMEQFKGLDAETPQKVIRCLTERLLAKYKADGSVACRSMSEGLRLVRDMIDFSDIKSVDGRLRAACESVILLVKTRFSRHDRFVASSSALMAMFDNFDRERQHWWRKYKAIESANHATTKWNALLADLPALLCFHNSLLHAADLLEKPTLKHTANLCSMTVEGKCYENGNGRSIASECRFVMVRKECELPILKRPERRPHINSDSADIARKRRKKSMILEHSIEATAIALQELSSSTTDEELFAETKQPLLLRGASAEWPKSLGFGGSFPPVLDGEVIAAISRQEEDA